MTIIQAVNFILNYQIPIETWHVFGMIFLALFIMIFILPSIPNNE